VSCGVLQCDAVCCSEIKVRGIALRRSIHLNDSPGFWEALGVCELQCVAVCCSVLQYVTVCCIVLQCDVYARCCLEMLNPF